MQLIIFIILAITKDYINNTVIPSSKENVINGVDKNLLYQVLVVASRTKDPVVLGSVGNII